MKKKLLKLIAAKEARKKELGTKAETTEDVKELRSINTDIDALNIEIEEFRTMIEEIPDEKQEQRENGEGEENVPGEKRGGPVVPQGGFNPLGTYAVGGAQQRATAETKPAESPEAAEKRGKELKEKRSVTIASTGVILPNYQANDIKQTFNEVSSLLDRVNVKNFIGGESFKQPYSTGYGEAGYATEGGDPDTAEATFGYAQIDKTKIAAYAEDSEELIKLPGADYDAEVQKGIRIALRKKITKEMLVGDGESGHFVGIFDDGAIAIEAATDKSFEEIEETTLDEIIYSFGGDEDVEDIAVLVLSKFDLKAFAMLRDADGKKIYKVKAKEIGRAHV